MQLYVTGATRSVLVLHVIGEESSTNFINLAEQSKAKPK